MSALEKAMPLLAGLKALESDRQERFRTPLFERYPIFLPIVIGKITADITLAKVPERCVFEGLMGYSPEETYQAARAELEAKVAEVAVKDSWLKEHPPIVEWHGLNKEGAQIPADHAFVRVMAESLTEVTGRQPTIAGFTAGCDLPLLIKYAGVPSVVFGPGELVVAHGSNEYVEISEVVAAAKIIAMTVLRWCSASRA